MAKKKNTSDTITRADLRANTGGVTASLSLPGFQPAATFVKPEGAIVRTMSPMVKPKDFPLGQVLVGTFTRIFQTNPGKAEDGVTDKIGEGVEIIPAGCDVGVSLAATAVLKTGLAITGKGNDAKSVYIGRTVAIQKAETRLPSKKGNDAWNFIVSIYPDTTKKELTA